MRSFAKTLLVLLCLAIPVGIAGCVQSPTVAPASAPGLGANGGVDWALRAITLTNDTNKHNHRDWTQHTNLSTPNFVELAHNPLGIKAYEDKSAGGYFCGGQATTPEGRRLTVINGFDTNLAFTIVDTTDPEHPVHLGDYFLDHAQTYDVDITPDGKHVAIAADLSPQAQGPPPSDGNVLASAGAAAPSTQLVTLHPRFYDACTGQTVQGPDQTVAAGPSTILVSVADPKNPVFEDIFPSPVLGPHSVSTAVIDNTTYIAASITNLVHQASYYQFFQVVMGSPTGGKLLPLSAFDAGAAGNPTAAVNGHVDAQIVKNPATKKLQVYLSDWDGGVIILDFSNPRAPIPLSNWQDKGAEGGAVHSTYNIEELHNGHHYFLAGQEFTHHPSDRPSGWIYILDDTDPTNIKEVGRWTLPVDSQKDWKGVELYSTHYFREVNGTVFVAMYHGGLWAFTLDYAHPEAMKEPPTVGVFVPDKGPDKGRDPKGFYDYSPFVLDVFPYPDDHIVVYDGLSGVYSLKYDPSSPMTAPKPWPASGVSG